MVSDHGCLLAATEGWLAEVVEVVCVGGLVWSVSSGLTRWCRCVGHGVCTVCMYGVRGGYLYVQATFVGIDAAALWFIL